MEHIITSIKGPVLALASNLLRSRKIQHLQCCVSSPNHRVMVKFGVTGRYTTSLSNIVKEGNRLILKSDIFKF